VAQRGAAGIQAQRVDRHHVVAMQRDQAWAGRTNCTVSARGQLRW
jgi:hypothetical protein